MTVHAVPRASTHDIEALSRVMDACFEIPGLRWRFGLNTLIDLVPGVGDAVTSLIAYGIVIAAVQRGIPRVTLLRMALNVAIYAVIGIVPFIGDAVDTWFKPNMRNMALLRRHLDAPYRTTEHQKADTLFVAGVLGTLALLLIGSLFVMFWVVTSVLHFIGL